MKPRRDAMILTGLTVATAAIAGWMVVLGRASAVEAVGFVTGALSVWLIANESLWNFPVSLANVATFGLLFLRAQLFGDAGLQVVYFVLTLIGWYLWLFGGAGRTALHISRAPVAESAVLAILAVILTPGLTAYFQHVGDALPFLDALTTVLSLAAQWMLNRKYLESWLLWIAVDVVYVPMYAYKGLYLTSFLYAVFLGMAVIGLLEWRRRWDVQRAVRPKPLLLQETR